MPQNRFFFWMGDQVFEIEAVPEGQFPRPVRVETTDLTEKGLRRFQRRTWGTSRLYGWLWPGSDNLNNSIRVMAFEPWSKETYLAGYLPEALAIRWLPLVRKLQHATDTFPAFPAEFIGTGSKKPLRLVLAVNEQEFPGEMPLLPGLLAASVAVSPRGKERPHVLG